VSSAFADSGGTTKSKIHMPDSEHVAMALFLVPRGIDRILTGRELTA
jgi:hypothetical protein